MPTLSIIVPTFNASTAIERCLQSVRIQTFRDYEIILQDGASSDDTVAKAKAFRNASPGMDIKIFIEKDNGPYDAMNKGCLRSSGEWLYFLGSDDELRDGNVLSTVMSSPGIATCEVVYGNVQVIGDAGWANHGTVYDGIFDLSKLLNRNICHQAIFYRAAFARGIGEYNIRYVVCADWDFNMRCWAKIEFKYLDMIVANFYAGGLSGVGSDECFSLEVASNVLKYFGLSVYDPLVNTPAFAGFADILKMRQSHGSFRRIVSRIP
jgi:glycosyltransferase involved in cell wall biosynthesis